MTVENRKRHNDLISAALQGILRLAALAQIVKKAFTTFLSLATMLDM